MFAIYRNTIFGNLILEDDWTKFSQAIGVHKHSSIAQTVQYPIFVENFSYLICLEGEIVVTLVNQGTGSFPMVIKTYRPGDVVHLFPYDAICFSQASERQNPVFQFPGSMLFGKYRLSFSCRTIQRKGVYAFLDIDKLDSFLAAHSHLYVLQKLTNFDIVTHSQNAYDFEGLSKDQVSSFLVHGIVIICYCVCSFSINF